MSNKKDLLGAGSSFTRKVSARRAAIEASTEAPTEGALPPVELPLTAISLNPANPRSEIGDLTELAGSLKDHGQKTAISVMSRFAYLEAYPAQDSQLEADTKYVVVDGNSRLAAAALAGLATIKVMLDDSMGDDPNEILESALVANIHRQDLDPLDEARALEQLLKVHGTQTALAQRLHRSQGWVAQRMALLGLTDDLKEKLAAGTEPAELLRRVGKKKQEEQQAALDHLKKEKQDKAAASRRREVPASGAPDTMTSSGAPAQPTRRASPEPSSSTKRSVPPQGGEAPSPSSQAVATPDKISEIQWTDEWLVREMLMEWMKPEARQRLFRLFADEFDRGIAETRGDVP